MKTITVKVKNKKQGSKIKAALKLVDAEFIENESDIKPSKKFLETLNNARKDYVNGNVIKIDSKNIWESIL